MNLIDAMVLEVLGAVAYHNHNRVRWYTVLVKYVDMGGEGITTLSFATMDEALGVKEGYKFQH